MQEEVYFCDSCQRNIPVINRTIHQLRCVPVPKADGKSTTQSQAEHESEKGLPVAELVTSTPPFERGQSRTGWTCDRCTYFNENTNPVCEVCGHSSLQIIDESEEEDVPIIPEDHVIPPYDSDRRQPSPPTCSAPSNSWQCSRCTLINPQAQDECIACGETRPFRPTRRERLIEEEPMEESFVFLNPTTQRQEIRRTRSSNVPSSAVLGATVGAGMALLNGRSMTRGALEGAGMGLLGGMVLDLMNEESAQREQMRASTQPRVIIHRGFGPAFGMTPFDLLAAELLAGEGRGPPQRVREETLRQLPTHAYKGPSAPPAPNTSRSSSQPANHSHSADPDRTTCAICLSSFVPGENLRTLPCLHHFHVQCIDRWLARSTACPICKYEIQ